MYLLIYFIFDISKFEERATKATDDLKDVSAKADESERLRKVLASQSMTDGDKVESLEAQLKVHILS